MNNANDQEIPQYIIDSFARLLLPEIQKFYESDEGKAYFEKWKAEQENADQIWQQSLWFYELWAFYVFCNVNLYFANIYAYVLNSSKEQCSAESLPEFMITLSTGLYFFMYMPRALFILWKYLIKLPCRKPRFRKLRQPKILNLIHGRLLKVGGQGGRTKSSLLAPTIDEKLTAFCQ